MKCISLGTRVLVGMPAYNEQDYVGSVVLLAKQYATEVLVVDDGSIDDTAKAAELAGATVVKHVTNRGYGAAIKTVLSEAKKRGADILVTIDADFQHDPDQIPSFTKAILDGNDVAIGSRKDQARNIPTYRRLGQSVLSSFARILSKSNIAYTECGFRAYSKKALDLLEPKEDSMAIRAEITSEATRKGLRITEVPISAIHTKDGSTPNPVKHGLGNLQRILYMISERRPLLIFGLLGGLSLLLGLAAGIMVARNYYSTNALAFGTALVSMLLVTVGILSVFTGLILDVLVRRVNGR